MKDFYKNIDNILLEIKENNLYKKETIITSSQSSKIVDNHDKSLINLCANNYLGLSNNKILIKTAKASLEKYGYGLSSVRFICGTQNIHKVLEKEISKFLGFEDAILYSSCFDANGGLFETILNDNDAIISDELNHASIIDGIRLCKAKRYRYKNNDMDSLEEQLKLSNINNARFKLIVTDGVFSMDGIIANLKKICALAKKYNALVMVDDSHATGFVGKNGKGTIEYCDVLNEVDILTSTLGKALGGASGGFICAKKNIIDLLRNKSRPYLFSNSLAPVIVATSIKVLEIIKDSNKLRDKLNRNKDFFRKEMQKNGFNIIPGEHPIIPIMLFDESIAHKFSKNLLAKGILAVAFSYPVVPKNKARIRVQISAKHSKAELLYAITTFKEVGKKLGVI